MVTTVNCHHSNTVFTIQLFSFLSVLVLTILWFLFSVPTCICTISIYNFAVLDLKAYLVFTMSIFCSSESTRK